MSQVDTARLKEMAVSHAENSGWTRAEDAWENGVGVVWAACVVPDQFAAVRDTYITAFERGVSRYFEVNGVTPPSQPFRGHRA